MGVFGCFSACFSGGVYIRAHINARTCARKSVLSGLPLVVIPLQKVDIFQTGERGEARSIAATRYCLFLPVVSVCGIPQPFSKTLRVGVPVLLLSVLLLIYGFEGCSASGSGVVVPMVSPSIPSKGLSISPLYRFNGSFRVLVVRMPISSAA